MFKEEMLTVTEDTFLEESWDNIASSYNDDYHMCSVMEVLLLLYKDPRREYHNLKHIHDSLKALESFELNSSNNKRNIELAIWFHDAIYTFSPGYDENLSQKLLVALLDGIVNRCASGSQMSDITALIDLTKGHKDVRLQETNSDYLDDGAIFVDIDLSILGSQPEEYDKYSKAIIREYMNFHPIPVGVGPISEEAVKDMIKAGRAQFLKGMLSRDYIFNTYRFRQEYEKKARENIGRELESLEEDLNQP